MQEAKELAITAASANVRKSVVLNRQSNPPGSTMYVLYPQFWISGLRFSSQGSGRKLPENKCSSCIALNLPCLTTQSGRVSLFGRVLRMVD
jgi:hypothetical protein